ncbi:type 1 glutamine amidotransferase domain-containing protein [Stenotrophomonas terrae]|uniref:type 1 glutamine amidotransferase domain-containing protein n=1 Tax=Stenotrophomonas terrae TaxID=405446 RepID=UPI00070D05E0|nr:type 1 glutamine amidotransferase domain-containing protein [Stenotrophomonas terrae]
MSISRLIPALLMVLLALSSGVGSAHASPLPKIEPGLSSSTATATSTSNPTYASSTTAADGQPGRILFVVASSKVHGESTLPASVSFGEVVNAWDTFQAAGHPVDFVSPDGGAVPILDTYVSQDMAPRLQDSRVMSGLRNTMSPDQVDPGRYRAVYYVGGSNAMYGVAEDRRLQDIATHVYERNTGVISAVCHGTAGIVNLRLSSGQSLLAGKRITGFPEEHEDQTASYFKQFPFLIGKTVQERGGTFRAIDSEAPYLEIDGRVMTGQNYASAAPLAQAVVDLLRTQPGAASAGSSASD